MKNNDLTPIITRRKITARTKALGKRITADYAGKAPVLICMLKGGVYFFSDLVRYIKLPVTIEFARISSYGESTTSGQINMLATPTAPLTGKDVIIVEDIVDTGKTLFSFVNWLKAQTPRTVKICTLLDKKECRKYPVNPDYIAFECPNSFVVGYGLDYAERYRELPYIARLNQ